MGISTTNLPQLVSLPDHSCIHLLIDSSEPKVVNKAFMFPVPPHGSVKKMCLQYLVVTFQIQKCSTSMIIWERVCLHVVPLFSIIVLGHLSEINPFSARRSDICWNTMPSSSFSSLIFLSYLPPLLAPPSHHYRNIAISWWFEIVWHIWNAYNPKNMSYQLVRGFFHFFHFYNTLFPKVFWDFTMPKTLQTHLSPPSPITRNKWHSWHDPCTLSVSRHLKVLKKFWSQEWMVPN